VGYGLPTSPVIYGTILPTPVLVSDIVISMWNLQIVMAM
jgi:hypothetical protein